MRWHHKQTSYLSCSELHICKQRYSTPSFPFTPMLLRNQNWTFHIKHQYEIIESWKPKKKIGFLKNNHDHGITFAQNIINFLNTLSDLMLQTVDVHVATLTGWGKSIQLHLASCKLSFRETTRSLIIQQFLFLI